MRIISHFFHCCFVASGMKAFAVICQALITSFSLSSILHSHCRPLFKYICVGLHTVKNCWILLHAVADSD